jgi:hypothetical protein
MSSKLRAVLISLLVCLVFTSSVLYLHYVQKKIQPISLKISGSIPYYTPNELSGLADLIVEGNVASISPGKWNTSDGKKPNKISLNDIIYREVSVNVKNVLKGTINVDSVIKVYSHEGIDESGFSVYSDAEPKFTEGEDVILFLSKDNTIYNKSKSSDHYIVTGLILGKYDINNGIATNEYSNEQKSIPLEDFRILIKNNVNTKLFQPPTGTSSTAI